jgi:predicted transcriptional regulator
MEDSNLLMVLENLGLDSDCSAIYICLIKNVEITALEISRKSGVERAKVYRKLEEMVKKGLVSEIIDSNRRVYKVGDSERLVDMYKEKEIQMKTLSQGFDTLLNQVKGNGLLTIDQPGTKVLFYRGMDSIKQQLWNVLKAKTEIVGYTHRSSLELMGENFYRDWSLEFNLRGLYTRDIVSQSYLDRYASTPELEKSSPEIHNDTRVLPDKSISIQVQMDIYDGVVSYYSWTKNEIFGVEIYNDEIFSIQKQLFEIAWNTAKPI